MHRRRYTAAEKQAALARLRENSGNVRITSAETGINPRTLRAWAQRQQSAPAPPPESEPVEARLRDLLMDNILRLADSLEATIDDAPLNQRASALAQLIDRLLKLADKLPDEQRDHVLRMEYVDPDGSVHATPPWARERSES
ncbi:MAG: transposase [Chloroflexi bacterium]|nr:transposase [Chloroflexota bacterium]